MPDKRPRGYQPGWRPRPATRELLAAVDLVLARFAGQLPLTIRQCWYALVSDGVLAKEERTYKRLVEVLGMARRSGRIPWQALRDDTEISVVPVAYDGPVHFHGTLLAAARDFRLDRQAGQPVSLEVWSETAGMVPQLTAVTDPYGVPVYSGSGFNSLPGKRGAALRAATGGHRAVRILVVSDWDPSGVHLFSALAEDVTAFAAVDVPDTRIGFERLAVTEQQIADHQLPTAPAKPTDRRSFAGTSTTQAEALPPDVITHVLRTAIEAHRDLDVLAAVLEREEEQRREIIERLQALGGSSHGHSTEP
ncbi:hypothetical protein [Streptomyces poonensis]|uniref:DUF2399 domain-containing protein n=1 Tax=Streptomyces poonensis TaxID=68255 RepID=A0A918QGA9_9ACTN|nr:hypothetical protein [Streptomyces poonensis]GGZ42768.1 hypothetical protein GCM10010365_74370 [Streptomyces poonensis]